MVQYLPAQKGVWVTFAGNPLECLAGDHATGTTACANASHRCLKRCKWRILHPEIHNLRMVSELLPRTIILDEGRIVADGPTGDVLNDATLLEAHGLLQ